MAVLATAPGMAATAAVPPVATTRPVAVRLTGLNRAGHVVSVPQAELLEVNGFATIYQGAPVTVNPGRYIIAAEVPTYAGSTVTSQTLVVRLVRIRKSETIRLDARTGRRLQVVLTGAQAHNQDLAALACLTNSPGSSDQAAQGAWGGNGVAVYAVPSKSAYVINFAYLSILQSTAGAHYYLVGSSRGTGIPARLSYRQRAARLAKMTMVLRGGAFGSASLVWGITSGNGQSFCGSGQNAQVMQPQSWVNYLTPGTWTTDVETYAQGRSGALNHDASFESVRRYRAGASYSDVFGAAVAGPSSDFPAMAANQFQYDPSLFGSPGVHGGSICCSVTAVTLRLGKHVVKKQTLTSSCQSCFVATLHVAGWYTLTAAARRMFPGGRTPGDLLSPEVAVSFRFHATPTPPGSGNWENFPLTDVEYQPLGLNLDNRAPAGGTTMLHVLLQRPGNAGTPTPVYRLKSIRLQVSVDGGATWQPLKIVRSDGSWRATVHDPVTGFVSLRSVVTDVHGDRTEQTVYRAYAVI
ncbi:MAG: hypothetical protein ACLQFR_24925 [Streptosporangiaceae bacterium]